MDFLWMKFKFSVQLGFSLLFLLYIWVHSFTLYSIFVADNWRFFSEQKLKLRRRGKEVSSISRSWLVSKQGVAILFRVNRSSNNLCIFKSSEMRHVGRNHDAVSVRTEWQAEAKSRTESDGNRWRVGFIQRSPSSPQMSGHPSRSRNRRTRTSWRRKRRMDALVIALLRFP